VCVLADTHGDHPDGICREAEGAVWCADVGNQHCVRVGEGGEVMATVELDRGAFACALAERRIRTCSSSARSGADLSHRNLAGG
jgi:sugar lactone lactonase YvrE